MLPARVRIFGMTAFWVGVLAALLTSFYSWRLIFMTFHGKYRWIGSEHIQHAHESPAVMQARWFCWRSVRSSPAACSSPWTSLVTAPGISGRRPYLPAASHQGFLHLCRRAITEPSPSWRGMRHRLDAHAEDSHEADDGHGA